jgi:hypothetical protein
MTRLYESPGHRLRTRISLIILIGLILLGIWYLVFRALAAPPGIAGLGPWALSIAFIVAGVAGLVRVLNGARDWVIAMDMEEETGKVVIWLRGALGARRIKTEIHQLCNWRYSAAGRSGRARFRRILADLKGRRRPLIFDVRLAHPVPDGLRRVAPQAVADYERDVGIS